MAKPVITDKPIIDQAEFEGITIWRKEGNSIEVSDTSYDSVSAALKDIANRASFAYEAKWTTQQLGSKLIAHLKNRLNNEVVATREKEEPSVAAIETHHTKVMPTPKPSLTVPNLLDEEQHKNDIYAIYKKACDKDAIAIMKLESLASTDQVAEYYLGVIYFECEDYSNAHSIFIKLYKSGFKPAAHSLYLMYSEGLGVERDRVESLLYLKEHIDYLSDGGINYWPSFIIRGKAYGLLASEENYASRKAFLNSADELSDQVDGLKCKLKELTKEYESSLEKIHGLEMKCHELEKNNHELKEKCRHLEIDLEKAESELKGYRKSAAMSILKELTSKGNEGSSTPAPVIDKDPMIKVCFRFKIKGFFGWTRECKVVEMHQSDYKSLKSDKSKKIYIINHPRKFDLGIVQTLNVESLDQVSIEIED